MRSKRIACIFVRHLPVQVERRLNASLDGVPVVISGLAWKPDVVLDVSEDAIGVTAGMSVRQVKQVCPEAYVLSPREELYFALHNTVLQVCEQFSPQIETAGIGYFFIDVSNMERLYSSEEQLALAIISSIAHNTNLVPQVGIASNKFTAEQACLISPAGSFTVVLPGREREFLESFHIRALPKETDPEILRRLDLFGISTLGEFAALPPDAVSYQFGPGARSVHDLARGIDARPLDIAAPPPAVTHSANFTYDPLRDRFILGQNVEKVGRIIAEMLEVAGYHAEAIRVVVKLDNDEELQGATTIRPPTSEIDPIVTACLRVVETIKISRPVASMQVTGYPLRPWYAGAQQLGFLDMSPAIDRQRRLQLALQALWSRFGEMMVRVALFVVPPAPLEIQVQTNVIGRPAIMHWGDRTRTVVHVFDHWRSSSRWWESPNSREHYFVQTMYGGTYSVFAEKERWYLDRRYPR